MNSLLTPYNSPQITITVALLAASTTLALPLNQESTERAELSTEAPSADSSNESAPEGTIFNYEIPTEDELSPGYELDEEQKRLQELQPPAIDSYVPFAVQEVDEEEPEPKEQKKPKKGGKKYNAEEKWINKKQPTEAKDSSSEDNGDRQYDLLDFIIENLFHGIADQYNAQRRANENTEVLVLNKGEYVPNPQRRVDEEAENERVLFQIHGHLGGPKSYKFGFDTGKE